MNNIAKFLIVASVAAVVMSAEAQSVLTVSDKTIQEPATIIPRSAETDTKAMLESWYLKNYAVLDHDADSKDSGDLSDEVLLQRLQALPTVIEMPLNSVVKNAIKYYAGRKQLVENLLGLSLYYMPIFEEALERHGLPLELRYLPVIESALVPTAVSRAGAGGLWQFMPATASGLDLEVNSLIDQRRDPYLASEAAAKYLKQLYETFDDWSLAIAAYNCGPGNVNKAIRRAGGDKPDFWSIYYFLPKETRGYVPAFIAANYIMTYYKEHGISPALARRPIITDSVHVNKRVHFNQISDVLNIPVEEIRVLNPQYRKDIIPGDTRPYSLVLPSMQVYSYIMSQDSILAHDAATYKRRTTVEPSSSESGEYTTKLVIKRHKVRRGETFSSIAKKYGVTINEIKSWNGIKRRTKTLARGKVLKIHTYERVAVPKKEEPDIDSSSNTYTQSEQPDTLANHIVKNDTEPAVENCDTTAAETIAQVEKPQPQKTTKKETKTTKRNNKPKIHTVKRGDNLVQNIEKISGNDSRKNKNGPII